MAKQYMDYGVINNSNIYTPIKSLTQVDTTKHGQVFLNTHKWVWDKDQNNNITGGRYISLPFLNKAYISFSYGGKNIEDFGLNAITVNDRLQRETPPSHEDYTTQYKMLNGQYYWGSRYNAREMTITLATDGMSQQELDEFKYWFQPGEIKELILSEHPNRGILARIAEAPQISVLPFKTKRNVIINKEEKTVILTEYKGNIQLNFVMDEPFWYAINDVLGDIELDSDNGYVVLVDKWKNANGEQINVLDDDGIKTVAEDKIPTGQMIKTSINLAGSAKLIPELPYKYTLTNTLVEVSSTGEKGTPLVNELRVGGTQNQQSGKYPFSGAVAGPLYYKNIDSTQQITEIPKNWVRENIVVDITSGALSLNTNQNIKSLMMFRELPILKNSTITLKDNIPVTGYVILYNIDTMEYLRTEVIGYLNRNDSSTKTNMFYSFQNDYYVRICIVFDSDREVQSINDLLMVNIICLNQGFQSIDKNKNLYYFYSGNAPSYPTLSFRVPIQFDQNGYIYSFNNIYNLTQHGNAYNTLSLESKEKTELKLTNPSIFSSYNKVINKLLDESTTNLPISTVIQALRLQIQHPVVRNWIINCINIYQNTYNNQQNLYDSNKLLVLTQQMKDMLKEYMKYLFADIRDTQFSVLSQDDIPQEEITIDEIQFYGYEELTDGVTEIQCLPGSTVILTPKTKNVTFYQWQVSSDNNQWIMIKTSDDLTTEEGNALNFILDENSIYFNKYFRCVLSNDLYTVFSTPVKIVKIGTSLAFIGEPIITPIYNNNYLIFGNTYTLAWSTQDAIIGNSEIYVKFSSSDDVVNINSIPQQIEILSFQKKSQNIKINFKILNSNITQVYFYAKIYGIKYNLLNQLIDDELVSDQLHLYILKAALSNLKLSIYDGSKWSIKDNYNANILVDSKIRYSIEGNVAVKSYQWQYKKTQNADDAWTNFSKLNLLLNDTKSSIEFIATQVYNGYYIRCIATGYGGEQIIFPTISDEFGCKITIKIPDANINKNTITYPTTTYNKYVGDTNLILTALVNYNGNLSLTYQWKKYNESTSQWDNIDGAIESTYKINTLTLNNAGKYKYFITDEIYDEILGDACITVNVANKCIITAQPTNYTISQIFEEEQSLASVKKTISFSCTATNYIAYSWYRVNKNSIEQPIKSQNFNSVQSNKTVTCNDNIYIQECIDNEYKYKCVFLDQYNKQTISIFVVPVMSQYKHNLILSDEDIYNESKNDTWGNNYRYIYINKTTLVSTSAKNVQCLQTSIISNNKVITKITGTCCSAHYDNDGTIIYPNAVTDNFWTTKVTGLGSTLKEQYITDYESIEPIDLLLCRFNVSSYNNQTLKLQIKKMLSGALVDFDVQLKIVQLNSQNQIIQTSIYAINTSNNSNIDIEITSNINIIDIYLVPYFKGTWTDMPTTLRFSDDFQTKEPHRTNPAAFNKDDPTTWLIDGTSYKCQVEYSVVTEGSQQIYPSTRFMSRSILRANSIPIHNISTISQKIPFSINTAFGLYDMRIYYNEIKWPAAMLNNLINPEEICALSSLRHGHSKILEEKVGDMILLNNLKFQQQNNFDPITGTLKQWNESNPTLSYKLTYDGEIPLQQLDIQYKNYYL